MPKYRVNIYGDSTVSAILTVEGKTPEEAEDNALDELCDLYPEHEFNEMGVDSIEEV